jgi:hypothetical protein
MIAITLLTVSFGCSKQSKRNCSTQASENSIQGKMLKDITPTGPQWQAFRVILVEITANSRELKVGERTELVVTKADDTKFDGQKTQYDAVLEPGTELEFEFTESVPRGWNAIKSELTEPNWATPVPCLRVAPVRSY